MLLSSGTMQGGEPAQVVRVMMLKGKPGPFS